MTHDDVLEALRRERERLLGAVEALGPRATTASVTETSDGWTAKDVLAHLIHYAGQIAFALGAELQPPAYVLAETERLSGQEWNERAVAFWSTSTLDDVRTEFERNVDLIVDRVRLLSDDDLLATDRVGWPGEDRPLWQFIGHDTFLHEWPAHAEQIERAAQP
jgi:mycothiol maleylpyruvate isomerase-like protein